MPVMAVKSCAHMGFGEVELNETHARAQSLRGKAWERGQEQSAEKRGSSVAR